MLDIPRAVIFLVFALGIAVFALAYIMLTVTWGQRSVLLWMLIPLTGGIGLGLGKGESIDVLLFSLGGCFFMLAALMAFPRGRRRELYRREAAGEKVDWQEAAPPTWAVWVFTCTVCLWAVFSFVATGG
ncbi:MULTISPECIES: hypothetical protein [unclassified Streptomyces]|uniref:hypothetical protein n=1 Tax=unclassified Streptomyces TaxID=2593676 RepID=UPI002E29EB1C|nr:hypothetical protein [Streptomyces sp. NBC_01429]